MILRQLIYEFTFVNVLSSGHCPEPKRIDSSERKMVRISGTTRTNIIWKWPTNSSGTVDERNVFIWMAYSKGL